MNRYGYPCFGQLPFGSVFTRPAGVQLPTRPSSQALPPVTAMLGPEVAVLRNGERYFVTAGVSLSSFLSSAGWTERTTRTADPSVALARLLERVGFVDVEHEPNRNQRHTNDIIQQWFRARWAGPDVRGPLIVLPPGSPLEALPAGPDVHVPWFGTYATRPFGGIAVFPIVEGPRATRPSPGQFDPQDVLQAGARILRTNAPRLPPGFATCARTEGCRAFRNPLRTGIVEGQIPAEWIAANSHLLPVGSRVLVKDVPAEYLSDPSYYAGWDYVQYSFPTLREQAIGVRARHGWVRSGTLATLGSSVA